jgi:hypothetical protein
MTEAPNASDPRHSQDTPQPPEKHEAFVHRVCIQCNGVFRVPADKFDAKQCPNCHKG